MDGVCPEARRSFRAHDAQTLQPLFSSESPLDPSRSRLILTWRFRAFRAAPWQLVARCLLFVVGSPRYQASEFRPSLTCRRREVAVRHGPRAASSVFAGEAVRPGWADRCPRFAVPGRGHHLVGASRRVWRNGGAADGAGDGGAGSAEYGGFGDHGCAWIDGQLHADGPESGGAAQWGDGDRRSLRPSR